MPLLFTPIKELKYDMVVGREVRDHRGWLLVRSGAKITEAHLKLFRDKEIVGIDIYTPDNPKQRALERANSLVWQCQDALQKAAQEFQRQAKSDHIEIPESSLSDAMECLTQAATRAEGTVQATLALREWDQTFFQHGVNAALLTLFASKNLIFHPEERLSLGVGMLLHDYGFLHLPRDIHAKRGGLLPAERDIMRTHPKVGYDKLRALGALDDLALDLVLHHHERVDGTGYPDRLREADLAPITQLAAVVEVFSAMTQSRSYGRAAHPAQVAREILREIGTAFEQGAALALIQCVAVYPVGSAVQLNTGEYALVTSSALGHAMRPNVRVFYDANGQRIRPYDLNMVENSGYHITRYASTLEELKSHPSSEKEGMEQLGEFAA